MGRGFEDGEMAIGQPFVLISLTEHVGLLRFDCLSKATTDQTLCHVRCHILGAVFVLSHYRACVSIWEALVAFFLTSS